MNTKNTLAKMHKLLLWQHPDLTSLCKYAMYSDIFNYEFNISFGYPRSDICDLCERHQVAIKAAAANSNLAEKRKLEVEHELHIRKADVFTVQINEVTESAQALLPDGDTVVLAMDYQKNCHCLSQEYHKNTIRRNCGFITFAFTTMSPMTQPCSYMQSTTPRKDQMKSYHV